MDNDDPYTTKHDRKRLRKLRVKQRRRLRGISELVIDAKVLKVRTAAKALEAQQADATRRELAIRERAEALLTASPELGDLLARYEAASAAKDIADTIAAATDATDGSRYGLLTDLQGEEQTARANYERLPEGVNDRERDTARERYVFMLRTADLVAGDYRDTRFDA